jgi:hypothetical protein
MSEGRRDYRPDDHYNHSDINVTVDCIPLILVICFATHSFIVSTLLSDNFTTISYGPSTLLTSITQDNLSSWLIVS